MSKLNPTELRIVRSLLDKKFGPGSALAARAASLEIEPRHLTGTGYYARFVHDDDLPNTPVIDTELSEDYATNRESPADMVGFTLFIRGGELSSLEGYTFGDVAWPDEPMEEWLREAVEQPHQKAK